jgi:hypothetical protein
LNAVSQRDVTRCGLVIGVDGRDILIMRILIVICLACALFGPGVASAQFIPPGSSQLSPPLPPPPPPPRIEVPVIPQMDAPTTQNYAPAPQPSFSDRITGCLDEAAANGLGPSARAAYSRACANQ